MRAVNLPINSWVWVYKPRALPLEGDKLDNRKLSIAWARPYLFKGMKNQSMAQIGKIDESGKVVKRFLVHGSKVRLCQLGGEQEDDQRHVAVRLGMLPDFLDSKGSGPLYQVEAEAPAKRESQFSSITR